MPSSSLACLNEPYALPLTKILAVLRRAQNLRFDEVHAMLQKAKAHAQLLRSVSASCTFPEED